jgi:REP element-mobilizing transposase RayT
VIINQDQGTTDSVNASKTLRGYGALRFGRTSEHGSDYFLTLCLQRPQTGLTSDHLLGKIFAEINRLEDSAYWAMRTAVVMPDHVHLLTTLGKETGLSATLRLFKGRLTAAFRGYGLRWQPSFYDHHLRSTDEILPTFQYIFLNPYKAGLIGADKKWPGHFCGKDDWIWFKSLTADAQPFPEWLQ